MEGRKNNEEEKSASTHNKSLLPWELWRESLSHVDKREDMNAARLTCRLFYHASLQATTPIPYHPPLDYATSLGKDILSSSIALYGMEKNNPMLAFSNDVVVIKRKGTLLVIHHKEEAPSVTPLSSNYQTDITSILKFSKNAVVCAYQDKSIRLWDIQTKTCLQTWVNTYIQNGLLAVRKDGVIVSYGEEHLSFWDVAHNNLIKDVPIWQAKDGKTSLPGIPQSSRHSHQSYAIQNLFINEHDHIILIINHYRDNTHYLCMWDKNGQFLETIPFSHFQSDILSLRNNNFCLLPNNRLLGMSHFSKAEMSIWNFKTNEKELTFTANHDELLGFWGEGFAMRRDIIITRGSHYENHTQEGIALWNRQGECIQRLSHPHINQFDVNPDGSIITLGEDIRTWHFAPKIEHQIRPAF